MNTGDAAEVLTSGLTAAAEAGTLLDVLTPIAKSWPSEWCLEANSLAIQVLGGYGYTRDYPVEQYWRDNRLNMIHEGTHGIQALDLLGRKVVMNGGAGLALLGQRVQATVERAAAQPDLADHARSLGAAWDDVVAATHEAWSTADPQEALANATPYLQAFGHAVLAWIWLDVALCAGAHGASAGAELRHGKRAACRYFFHYELPRIGAWLGPVRSLDATCRQIDEAWF